MTLMILGDIFTNSVTGAEKLISPFTELILKNTSGSEVTFGRYNITMVLGIYNGLSLNSDDSNKI